MCCICERELFAGVIISNRPQLLKAKHATCEVAVIISIRTSQSNYNELRTEVTHLTNIPFNVPLTNNILYKLNAIIFYLTKVRGCDI